MKLSRSAWVSVTIRAKSPRWRELFSPVRRTFFKIVGGSLMPIREISQQPVVLVVVATAAILAAAMPARAEEWTKSFDLTGRPNVRIETNDGGVRVLTGAGYKQVAVRIEYSGYEPDRDFTIDTTQNGNRIAFSARLRTRLLTLFTSTRRSFSIEVRMPADAELQVDTGDGGVDVEPINGNVDIHTGDGHIRLDGAKGEIRLRTGDGQIEAARLDGRLDASSGDGHIRADGRFDRLNIETGDGSVDIRALPGSQVTSAWAIHTGDGGVILAVPENLRADVDAHTGDGGISLGIPIQVEGKTSRNRIRGKLNGGGPALNISTGDGSIRLSRS